MENFAVKYIKLHWSLLLEVVLTDYLDFQGLIETFHKASFSHFWDKAGTLKFSLFQMK